MKDWLDKTRELQIQAYGVDPSTLEGEERVQYFRVQILALVNESMEALDELSWKTWTTKDFFNRDAVIGELVDVAHFLANCAVAAGCTDAEWEERYHAKMKKNVRRQELGYDGVSEKCGSCKRALDDDAVLCVKSENPAGVQFWCERTKAWTATTAA